LADIANCCLNAFAKAAFDGKPQSWAMRTMGTSGSWRSRWAARRRRRLRWYSTAEKPVSSRKMRSKWNDE